MHKNDSILLELAENFPISFQALGKHIKILVDADLVVKKKAGKYRILSLYRNPLNGSLKWISYYASFWYESFDELDEQIDKENTNEQI